MCEQKIKIQMVVFELYTFFFPVKVHRAIVRYKSTELSCISYCWERTYNSQIPFLGSLSHNPERLSLLCWLYVGSLKPESWVNQGKDKLNMKKKYSHTREQWWRSVVGERGARRRAKLKDVSRVWKGTSSTISAWTAVWFSNVLLPNFFCHCNLLCLDLLVCSMICLLTSCAQWTRSYI